MSEAYGQEEFNQAVISLSSALVNQYLKADHEMLRRDRDLTLIERKHLERPVGPRLLCQSESGLRAVDAQISLQVQYFNTSRSPQPKSGTLSASSAPSWRSKARL